MWQYFAAMDGWKKANTPDDGSLTKADEDALWDMIQRKTNSSQYPGGTRSH